MFGHKIYLQYEDWENREKILEKLLENYDFYNHVEVNNNNEKMYTHGEYGGPMTVEIDNDAEWVELTFERIYQI